MNLAVVIDPTNDHVCTNMPVVARKAKTHVSLGLNLYLEYNVSVSRCPQYQEVVVQHSAIRPLEGRDNADKSQHSQNETVSHKGGHFARWLLRYTLSICNRN